ncbi:DUF3817 domain-containing protein [Flavobacterium silvaticum]|uniref:DUF3817 domain-containing protein n=1 Tax=Flavobacterium silvaticum TaxID=1852020 RepID=A0A972FTA6_9FLAO|nr:DUF3817 domain-containing protein [Flavobacterium silvaticum]NMH28969.1 DUF3817 domain-containing protein [Flavobacterium silvaticum]
MLKFFKIVALLEGISLLLLFFVAMPLKYVWDKPEYVRTVGMAHGLLFILYIILAFMLKSERGWNSKQFALVCFASVLPFGTFYIDWKYLRSAS